MKCKIKLISKQQDYQGASFFDTLMKDFDVPEPCFDFDVQDIAECFYEGDIEITDGKVTVSYVEKEEYGMDGSKTSISFFEDKPKEIYLKRTGKQSTSIIFREGERQISAYDTGLVIFETCFYSRSVDNRLLTDGTLEIKYIVEIKGACAQKTVLRMEIQKL